MSSVLILIPTYNEAVNVSRLLREILKNSAADVLVIDDNSPDGTGSLVAAIARGNPRIQVLHRPKKLGLASAYREGFFWALRQGYEFIVQMDCDLSHDPKYLPLLLEHAKYHDLVVGSRYIPGGALIGLNCWRRMLSKVGNLYVLLLLGWKDHTFVLQDATGGFNCWRAELLRNVSAKHLRFRGYGFQVELKWRACLSGASIMELPIVFRNRVSGKSKFSPNTVAEAMLLPFRL